jgi:hypothetical protein
MQPGETLCRNGIMNTTAGIMMKGNVRPNYSRFRLCVDAVNFGKLLKLLIDNEDSPFGRPSVILMVKSDPGS